MRSDASVIQHIVAELSGTVSKIVTTVAIIKIVYRLATRVQRPLRIVALGTFCFPKPGLTGGLVTVR